MTQLPQIRIETLLEYTICGLRAKYINWGADLVPKDERQVAIQVVRRCIRAWFQEAIKEAGNPKRALMVAHDENARCMREYGPLYTSNMMINRIIQTLEAFDDGHNNGVIVGPQVTVPMGPVPDAVVGFEEGLVVGDILGAVLLDADTRKERIAVCIVYPSSRIPSSAFRLLEGFYGEFMLRNLGEEWSDKISTLRVDPYQATAEVHRVLPEDMIRFRAISKAILVAMGSDSYPANPGPSTCGRCSFEKKCQIEHCSPGVPTEEKERFLKSLEAPEMA